MWEHGLVVAGSFRFSSKSLGIKVKNKLVANTAGRKNMFVISLDSQTTSMSSPQRPLGLRYVTSHWITPIKLDFPSNQLHPLWEFWGGPCCSAWSPRGFFCWLLLISEVILVLFIQPVFMELRSAQKTQWEIGQTRSMVLGAWSVLGGVHNRQLITLINAR